METSLTNMFIVAYNLGVQNDHTEARQPHCK